MTPADDTYVVRMEGVGRRFPGPPEVTALAGADVAIRRGEHVSIMGPSGSGKSTLLNIMGLLDAPTTGTYELNGQDVARLRDKERTALRGQSIGFVFQDFHLMNQRTAQENVALGLVYAGYDARSRRDAAAKMLEAVGLGHRVGALPTTMSGGERQRVAIARALVNNPSLLLCDEPTGNLDTHTSAQVMDILEGLHDRGVSVVTITHNPEVAARADRTITIEDGRTTRGADLLESADKRDGSSPRTNGTVPVRGQTEPFQPRRWLVWPAVVAEAVAGLGQKVSRTVLTMVGTAIGEGAIVAILGLTATAAGQIDSSFSALQATQVTINDAGPASPAGLTYSFPPDAPERVAALNGVEASGIVAPAPGGGRIVSTRATLATSHLSLPVYGATRGYFDALVPTWSAGGGFTAYEEQQKLPVVVAGAVAARQLGISAVGAKVFVDGSEYVVVGILDAVGSRPESLTGVFIPLTTMLERYGEPTSVGKASMLIRTKLGAAGQVASEAPLALRPDAPRFLAAIPPPDPPHMRSVISTSMSALFVALAAVTLLIGTAAIANTTLVAIIERSGEIGLRRAIGASPRHIMAQFLLETVLSGLFAAVIGTSVGVIAVLATAIALNWTAVIDPGIIALGPVIGACTGFIAGIFPAWKAGHIAPITALRK